jgi:magnesium transporter
MPRAQYERVLSLLRYPEDTAGGIMTNDTVVLREDITVGEALARLREQLKRPDFINFIQMVFVVDDEARRRLRGVMSLRDLLVADEERKLAEVMDPYIVTLAPLEPAINAARRVIDNELTGLPVVGPEGKLLGVVTVDSALVLATPAGWGGREAPRLFS